MRTFLAGFFMILFYQIYRIQMRIYRLAISILAWRALAPPLLIALAKAQKSRVLAQRARHGRFLLPPETRRNLPQNL
jgi:hypothetical protein